MVSKTARLGHGVWIGPKVIISEDVSIGPYSIIGGAPEHRGFYDDIDMEKSHGVFIGRGARIFEFVTIHAGTLRPTVIDYGAAIFNKSHIGHDCHVGIRAQIGGQCSLAGHVEVMEGANVSGKSCVLQWAVIGAYAFVGGFTFVTKHIPPGEKWIGFPARPVGENTIGLQRADLSYHKCRNQFLESFEELTKEKHL